MKRSDNKKNLLLHVAIMHYCTKNEKKDTTPHPLSSTQKKKKPSWVHVQPFD
jgi:hypothetical protein